MLSEWKKKKEKNNIQKVKVVQRILILISRQKNVNRKDDKGFCSFVPYKVEGDYAHRWDYLWMSNYVLRGAIVFSSTGFVSDIPQFCSIF